MVVQSEKMFLFIYPFSILILFSCSIMSAKYGEIWEKHGRCLTWLVLEMTADSESLQDFLQCMGLIRLAWEN